jgi:phosphate transport system substrate-binding protein
VRHPKYLAVASAFALALGAAACGDDDSGNTGSTGSSSSAGQDLSGTIAIDGSSTVYPFAQAAAEAFQGENPNVKITVGQSGTGGGFEKFCAGETDISDASRPIEPEEEKVCKDNGIDYSHVQVANDGIALVSNPELGIDCMTVDQLAQLWSDDKVTNYSQLDPSFPDVEVSLFGPGTDSGTFDYFTDAINGEEGLSRKDYQPSEDDNVLVQGVEGDAGGLGYFGFSYYEQNADKLNLIGVDDGSGCVKPEAANIQDGSYKPLSRPVFMYPSAKALEKPEVKAFVDFALANQETIAENAAMVPMTPEQASEAQAAIGSGAGA